MNVLIEILYTFSTALLLPVILLLLGCVVWSLIEVGIFLREALERFASQEAYEIIRSKLNEQSKTTSKNLHADAVHTVHLSGLIALFTSRAVLLMQSPKQLTKLVSELEITAADRLARINFGVRIAPILGLMGTLIPMGPALKGLTEGSITVLSQNLVVVFSTTVLGLFVGGLCYTMQLFRRQWYARDLHEIEYLSELLQTKPNVESLTTSLKRINHYAPEAK